MKLENQPDQREEIVMADDPNDPVMQADRQVFRRLRNLGYIPQSIFDVGASNSGWSCYIKRVVPEAEFYLFEPLIDHSPAYQDFINQVLKIYPSFHLFKYALGEKSGTVTMKIFENTVSSTALNMPDSVHKTIPVEVPMLTLDSAVEKFNLPQPQVIKIDTQGSELAILKGATKILPQVDILFLECWLCRSYGPETPLLTEIADWLLQYNFRLWDIGDPYRNEQAILEALDCVFINANSNISLPWHY
ncbi:MAG: FkbM family methyltransferase [Cyanobacteriota bacterium]|jgi:FkbM family methyltransferase